MNSMIIKIWFCVIWNSITLRFYLLVYTQIITFHVKFNLFLKMQSDAFWERKHCCLCLLLPFKLIFRKNVRLYRLWIKTGWLHGTLLFREQWKHDSLAFERNFDSCDCESFELRFLFWEMWFCAFRFKFITQKSWHVCLDQLTTWFFWIDKSEIMLNSVVRKIS